MIPYAAGFRDCLVGVLMTGMRTGQNLNVDVAGGETE